MLQRNYWGIVSVGEERLWKLGRIKKPRERNSIMVKMFQSKSNLQGYAACEVSQLNNVETCEINLCLFALSFGKINMYNKLQTLYVCAF